ncbi:SoxXA-binding protein [Candidatus Vondammii sp. HM_W22]|uniref:SoxXA-binding protein n=1 Tax=Candidatus Vondammii sp. HM_W22 TaxID=2687299 RepID=UPI001F12CCB4|nr:SoxXA-binding protein [Candidatus Vondammii sp. HM_W22]
MRIEYMLGVLVLMAFAMDGISNSLAAEAAKAADPTAIKATQAIADADIARKKAASVAGEWRDTGKMIKKAKKLVDEGDFPAAIKLAGKAQQQGELGYDQAVAQTQLRLPSYLKN